MKSRREIWFALLSEIGEACSVSTTRDRKTVESRLEAEGDSFFTVALPQFEKDFVKSLADGRIDRTAFRGFSRRKVRKPDEAVHGVPVFLGGFLDLLFTSEYNVYNTEGQAYRVLIDTPVLRPWDPTEPDPRVLMAIRGIRQLCLLFSKEKNLCHPYKVQRAIDFYARVDEEVMLPFRDGRADLLFEGQLLDRARRVLRMVFGHALSEVDQKIYYGECIPNHGPGATADKRRGNRKWDMPYWHDRLEYLFPYREYALPNMRYACEEQEVTFLSPQEELPVRLTAVPKTQTTPRLIAIEPTVMQYIQQGIMASLVPAIELDPIAGSFVHFTDQVPNQQLARNGSWDGSLATLDLSEASDRVANWLVEDMFSDFPHFLEGIQACRSTSCQLPSGEVIPLQKFASMGSALTFPIEAMVFATVALLGCLGTSSTYPNLASIKRLMGSVRVYGDDIIVPSDKAVAVIEALETFGFVVNRRKSFWTGSFRESCGKEYYAGHDVSVVKVREHYPSSRRSVKELVSLVSFRNQLCEAGWLETVELLDRDIENMLGIFPYVSANSPLLGRVGPEPPVVDRWNKHLHRMEVKGYTVRAVSPISPLDGVQALTKVLMHPGISKVDREHLVRSGRPRAVGLKLAWAPVY